MLSNDELSAAVGAGVIARTDADKLAAFLADYRATRGGSDEGFDDAESIRFVRGLHDVFLTIGLVLLILGIGFTTQLVANNAWPFAVAAASWALAEYFTKAKRLTLPSIALSIAFGVAGGLALMRIGATSQAGLSDSVVVFTGLLSLFAMFISSAMFYLRFRLPFTLAQLVVSIAAGVLPVFGGTLAQGTLVSKLVCLALGLIAFTLAINFDLKDPQRRTVAADNAFWLHLAAAPLIVHAAIGFVWTDKVANLSLSSALLTMAVIFALAFVALVIDRRALLVSGLFYFGAALFVVIRTTSVQEPAVLAITLLILGGALVLLGVGWRGLRRTVVNAIIPAGLARRLPTLRTDSQ